MAEQVVLTEAQARLVSAVLAERDRFMKANEAAMQELMALIGLQAGIPEEAQVLGFRQDGPGAPVMLEWVEEKGAG